MIQSQSNNNYVVCGFMYQEIDSKIVKEGVPFRVKCISCQQITGIVCSLFVNSYKTTTIFKDYLEMDYQLKQALKAAQKKNTKGIVVFHKLSILYEQYKQNLTQ